MLILDTLKFEKHSRFQARSFENYQLTFISGDVSVRVVIVYRLRLAKNNRSRAGNSFREMSEFVDLLTASKEHLLIIETFNVRWDFSVRYCCKCQCLDSTAKSATFPGICKSLLTSAFQYCLYIFRLKWLYCIALVNDFAS